MTIDLPLELEMQLRDEAAKEGMALDRFVLNAVEERLHQKRVEQSVPHLSKAESDLMQRINEGLPVETWRQYHALIAKRNAGTLTADEQKVLVSLVSQVELDHAHRLGLVLELANLHGIPLDAEMEALGIPRYSYK